MIRRRSVSPPSPALLVVQLLSDGWRLVTSGGARSGPDEMALASCEVVIKMSALGYPPDLQDEAVQIVLKQTELLCAEWV